MAGYIKILRTDLATGTHGRSMEEYRFAYVSGGNSWTRSFDLPSMESFLIHNIGLSPDRAADVIQQARVHGTSTVPGVDIPEHIAAAMGLTQLPSDEG